MKDKTRIVHEESGQEAYVVGSAVNAWLKHGWTVEEDGVSQEAAVEAKPEPSPKPRTNGGPVVPDTSKKE